MNTRTLQIDMFFKGYQRIGVLHDILSIRKMLFMFNYPCRASISVDAAEILSAKTFPTHTPPPHPSPGLSKPRPQLGPLQGEFRDSRRPHRVSARSSAAVVAKGWSSSSRQCTSWVAGNQNLTECCQNFVNTE